MVAAARRGFGPGLALQAAGAAVVAAAGFALLLCARDPLTLLLGWELMSLLPAVVILVARGADRPTRRTVFTYVGITHLGSAGTWIAVLLLAHAGAIGNPAAIDSGSGLQI